MEDETEVVRETNLFVIELLNELVESVCNEERSFKCIASSLPVELCGIVNKLSPQNVVNGFCDRSGRWELLQLKCVDQKASDELVTVLELTRSSVRFWRRYWTSIRILLDHVEANNEDLWWPWTQDNILLGEMERSYLSYLLMCDPYIVSLAGQQHISVIYFSYGCVQNSSQEVCELQDTIESFRKKQSYHVFILGVTNHWVTVYAYHNKKHSKNEPTLSLLYWDSNNISILHSSDADIEIVVNEKEKEKVKRKGYGYKPWKRAVFRQSLSDQRDLVILLSECLSGEKAFKQCVLCGLWNSVLDSFEKNVGEVEEDEFLSLLLQWLENDYLPSSLQNHQVKMLVDLGIGCLDKETQKRLLIWLTNCLKKLAGYCSGILLVDHFSLLLWNLKQHFDMHCE